MEKPNIILITTDQQRFDTINALGNNYIYTPHLNWLVDQGITFSRCYSDSPICMPARATIMTGLHGFTTGLVGNTENIKPMVNNPTLPELLTQNGYQTRAQGKMHFSPMRANYGFEHMELPMDYFREMNKNNQMGIPKDHGVGENEIEPVISTVNESNSLTHWTVKRSIDFLETRDESRPFFLWTSFTKPHPPYDPCVNYWSLYRDREILPPVCGDWAETVEKTPQGYLRSTYCLNNAYRMTQAQLMDVKRAYYACITEIDYSLGLLFTRLRELNLLENTWIIFTSDHGDMMGDHHMGAKSVFLEGSAHVPLIIRPPHTVWEIHERAASNCETLVDLADILPTILSIAGIDIPKEVDGTNIMKFVDSNDKSRKFFGNCESCFFTVIDKEYKYMWTSLGGDELLFNLKQDPYELCNLINSPEESENLVYMRQLLINQIMTYDKGELIKEGKLIHQPAPIGPKDIIKWPGFHSTLVPTDVLH